MSHSIEFLHHTETKDAPRPKSYGHARSGYPSHIDKVVLDDAKPRLLFFVVERSSVSVHDMRSLHGVGESSVLAFMKGGQ